MKERIFSGIKPSNELHIGNYLGALKQWVELQDKYESFFSIVDLHAITEAYDPEKMQDTIMNIAFDYLAAGLDPKTSTIFIQSHIPEHTELMWLLNTLTSVAELERMTQFKDKAGIQSNKIKKIFLDKASEIAINEIMKHDIKSAEAINEISKTLNKFVSSNKFTEFISSTIEKLRSTAKAGLLNYPVLMAADILLYKAQVVPVGEDQVQHVELTRVLARKFNGTFGQTFPEPKAKITHAKRIMSLTEPTKKMSKTDNEKSCIFLSDSPDMIKEKIMSAVTATTGGTQSAGVKNLFLLLKEFSDPKVYMKFEKEEQEKKIKYSELKQQLAQDIIDFFADFRKKRAALKTEEVKKILEAGAAKARPIAVKTLREVKQKMGLI
ncbi:MAG: tryptophan--tRNA ligase [Patescibacteria group bacterium]